MRVVGGGESKDQKVYSDHRMRLVLHIRQYLSLHMKIMSCKRTICGTTWSNRNSCMMYTKQVWSLLQY